MRRKAFVLLAVLAAVRTAWFFSCAAPGEADAESRLAFLAERLDKAHPVRGVTEGEWHLVALSMTGLAAANQAFRNPETRARRLALVERLSERALEPEARRFDTVTWGSDALETLGNSEGHVGYLGHLGLLLSTECMLGGHAHDEWRRKVVGSLERRYRAAPAGVAGNLCLSESPGQSQGACAPVVQCTYSVDSAAWACPVDGGSCITANVVSARASSGPARNFRSR